LAEAERDSKKLEFICNEVVKFISIKFKEYS
jgi:hypothetical protein